MSERLIEILILINDFVMAAIVIFGSAVFLYNLRHSLRDRVTRAFNSLLFFVVLVYFVELIVTRTTVGISTEIWIRLEWIGIAMVPAAQFHLSDALLVTTGDVSKRRRILVRVWYITGVIFFSFALISDILLGDLVQVSHAPHLSAGVLFPLFAIYFWLISAASIRNVWHARARCVTTTTRKRVSVIFVTFLAAPLAVFPYLTISDDPALRLSPLFLLFIIVGNLTVSAMFAFLTYYIAYFGATSPDRVVRVRLFKFMARVPMAATIVLVAYVFAVRSESILGMPVEVGLAIIVVASVILVEWSLHAFKRPLERLFQLTNEPEVRRIQQLSERVLTTRDMRQFLESVLAASCEVLRTPSAFIAAITYEGPRLEAVVGPLDVSPEQWTSVEIKQLTNLPVAEDDPEAYLESSDGFIIWHGYWIKPLHKELDGTLVGILGIKARAEWPNLNEIEQQAFDLLAQQASSALEDRILQQEVFAAVEGLLPQVTALQKRRSAATFGGAPVLTALVSEVNNLTDDPEFNSMVWDALSHYWGGPKLTDSPLLRLRIVQDAMKEHGNNPTKALRYILDRAVEQQKPEGERSMTTAEWILYNILELKFIQGQKVRDVARRLAMSESDLYRKQRVAIENVATTISRMEEAAVSSEDSVPESFLEPIPQTAESEI
jgi:GAF domain-containing protein